VTRLGLAVAIALLAIAPSAQGATAPAVQAQAYIVQSSVDGHTLAARRADAPRPMASIPKLMTALVALERLSLDDVVTVPPVAARVGESTLDLRAGQRISVRDLLIGTLVPSANDAATTLAVAAGGSEARFVALMNRKAAELGLRGTHYRNPHGLDQPGHVSTARDTAVLVRDALRVPTIRRYAGMSRATLSDGRVVESTDNLLGRVPGLVGGKTGHTFGAGWSQAAFASSGGVGITAVVLGSPTEAQRDQDLAALLRFGRQSYARVTVVDPRRTYATLPVGWGLAPVRAVAPRAIVRPASTDRPLTERVVVPGVLALPVAAGQRVGTVVVTDGSRVVARSPLVAAGHRGEPGVGARGWWVARRAVHHLGGLFS
jgi:D-alanyl-D-alanine carboxypeptidase